MAETVGLSVHLLFVPSTAACTLVDETLEYLLFVTALRVLVDENL